VDFTFKLNEVVETLQKFGIDVCIFSHLHSLKRENVPNFPVKKWGMKFYLVSSDIIDFDPVEIAY
jgi:predicted phosphohydrolase